MNSKCMLIFFLVCMSLICMTGCEPVIAPIEDGTVLEGTPYSLTPELEQSGGGAVTWRLETGPAGMTVDSASGTVRWPEPVSQNTPYNITLRAENNGGDYEESWLLTVSPVLRAYLFYFGTGKTRQELEQHASFIETAFPDATNDLVHLRLTVGDIMPFPPEDETHDYSTILEQYPYLLSEDVPRIWYRYNQPTLTKDIADGIDASIFSADDYDIIFVLSEAQFGSIGVYRYYGLKKPSVWVRPVHLGGWTYEYYLNYKRWENNYFFADEFLHEVGHYMGFGHACAQCNQTPLNMECCEACVWQNDVMSYCRERPSSAANVEYYNIFMECSQDYIENEFLPNFISTRDGSVNPQYQCNE